MNIKTHVLSQNNVSIEIFAIIVGRNIYCCRKQNVPVSCYNFLIEFMKRLEYKTINFIMETIIQVRELVGWRRVYLTVYSHFMQAYDQVHLHSWRALISVISSCKRIDARVNTHIIVCPTYIAFMPYRHMFT